MSEFMGLDPAPTEDVREDPRYNVPFPSLGAPQFLLDEYVEMVTREYREANDKMRIIAGKKPWSELTDAEKVAERREAKRVRRRYAMRHPITTVRRRVNNHVHRNCDW